LPCNLCGSQDGLRRDAMARLLTQLEHDSPNLRAVMLAALKNVSASHLLDPRLHARVATLEAPAAPSTPATPSPSHAPRRLPVLSS